MPALDLCLEKQGQKPRPWSADHGNKRREVFGVLLCLQGIPVSLEYWEVGHK